MIYLDHNATTPVDPKVLESMLPYFTEFYGNASSRTHLYGWDAREAVEKARRQLASALGVSAKEIVFTSGATEAVNLAIKGLYDFHSPEGKTHIVTVKTEHKAVLDTCMYLEKVRGASVTYLDVDAQGHIDPEVLRNAIHDKTLLVAIMYVNNETGLIHPVEQIARICREKDVFFFSDATQAVGKIPVNPEKTGIQLLVCSSHKIYGPKGVGALYIHKDISLTGQLNGGQQERKRRSGTLNVPGIVGFGAAVSLAEKQMKADSEKLQRLRDLMEKELLDKLPDVFINGDPENRMPHVSNLLIKGVSSEELLMALSIHVALSSGSACNAASVLPSHVLKAMGLSDEDGLSSIRISLGRQNTEAEIHQAVKKITEAVIRLRG